MHGENNNEKELLMIFFVSQTILSFLFQDFFCKSNVYAFIFCLYWFVFPLFLTFLMLARGWKVQNEIRRLLFLCVFEVEMVFRNLIKHV